jgi:hypothetical protein
VKPPATSLASRAPSAPVELVNDNPPALPIERQLEAHWSQAAHWVNAIKLFEVSRLAAQVMAGFELIQLHEHYAVKAGRPKKEFFHGERIEWSDVVKERLGISESSAWRWMEMAKAARPRLKKLGAGFGELIELMLTNPGAVQPDQLETVRGAVAKLTDGYTQLEFMEEMGLVKLSRSGATGGARTKTKADDAEKSPAELQAEAEANAGDFYRLNLPLFHDQLIKYSSWRYLPTTSENPEAVTLPMLHEILRDAAATIGTHLEARKKEALAAHRRTAARIEHTVES